LIEQMPRQSCSNCGDAASGDYLNWGLFAANFKPATICHILAEGTNEILHHQGSSVLGGCRI
jgi:hypothetical protein